MEGSIPARQALELEVRGITTSDKNKRFSVKDAIVQPLCDAWKKIDYDLLYDVVLKHDLSIKMTPKNPKHLLLEGIRIRPTKISHQELSKQVSSTLDTISKSGRENIDLLVNIFLENHLQNLAAISAINLEDKDAKINDVRETSTILATLGILMLNYKYVSAYVCLKKHDFSAIFDKYLPQIPYLKRYESPAFKSMTFLEVLFTFPVFPWAYHDIFTILDALFNSTGFAVALPDKKDDFDVSLVVLNQIVEIAVKMLDSLSTLGDSLETVLAQNGISAFLNFLRTRVATFHRKDLFNERVSTLAKNLLQSINKMQHKLALSLKSQEVLDQLKNYYASDMSETLYFQKVNESDYDRLRASYYKEFLLEDATANAIEAIIKEFPAIYEQVVYSGDGSQAPGRYQLHEKEDHIIQRKILSSIQREDNQDLIIKTGQLGLMPSTASPGHKSNFSQLKKLSDDYSHILQQQGASQQEINFIKNFGHYFEKNSFQAAFESTYYQNLPAGFKCDIEILKLGSKKLEPLKDNDRSMITALKEFFSKQTIDENAPDNDPAPIIKFNEEEEEAKEDKKDEDEDEEKKVDIKDEIIEEIFDVQKVETIKYFFHPDLLTLEEFARLEDKLHIKLKSLNEAVGIIFATIPPEYQKNPSKLKEILSGVIAPFFNGMTKFDENLCYCIMNKHSNLKNVPIEDIKDIKNEYLWIQDNFTKYLSLLEKVRGKILDKKPVEEDEENKIDIKSFLIDTKFKFVTDDKLEIKKKEDEKVDPEADRKLIPNLRNIWAIDETFVESVCRLFYTKYETNILSDFRTSALIGQLLSSPKFEIKLFDFFFFFLYSPEHISLIQEGATFPYNKLSNVEVSDPVQTFLTTTNNILAFIKNYFATKRYLLQQPKTLFEEFGLKSLKALKDSTKFQDKLGKMFSVLDMVVGILDIEEIKGSFELNSQVISVMQNIFAEPLDFEILQPHEFSTAKDQSKILSLYAADILVGCEGNLQFILNCPRISLSSYKFLQRTVKEVEAIDPIVSKECEDLRIKKKKDEKFVVGDFRTILRYESHLKNLDASIKIFRAAIVSLYQGKKTIPKENAEKVRFVLKELDNKFMKNLTVQDILLHIFELTELFHIFHTQVENQVYGRFADFLVNICVGFYSLYCYHVITIKGLEAEASSDGIPKLSKVASKDEGYFEEAVAAPKFMKSFSQMKKSKDINFDLLFSNLNKKYPKIVDTFVYGDPEFKSSVNPEALPIVKRIPWIVDFGIKKSQISGKIATNLSETNISQQRTLSIKRSDIIESSLKEFSGKPLKILRQKVSVQFQGEQGSDAGGLRRDYFSWITRDIFDPARGLFRLSPNGMNIMPNPSGRMIHNHLRYIELAGIILGKTIQEGFVVDVNLAKPVLKHILQREVTLTDLADIDADLAKNMRWILENPVDDLELTYTVETEFLGQKIIHELMEDGFDNYVTDLNKKDYVKDVCDYIMRTSIRDELEAFIRGINTIVSVEYFDLLGPTELSLLIAGVPEISFEDLKKYSKITGFSSESDIVKWLWEILGEFGQKELAALLLFMSGSLKVPYGSFKEKPLTFSSSGYGSNQLPIAHTCSWNMEVPQYKSKEDMKNKILLAIFEGQGSFDMA